jgi:hypothetical protein
MIEARALKRARRDIRREDVPVDGRSQGADGPRAGPNVRSFGAAGPGHRGRIADGRIHREGAEGGGEVRRVAAVREAAAVRHGASEEARRGGGA